MANESDSINKPTCFVIMPIADGHGYESGHFGRVYEHLLKPAITKAGYNAIRADDTNKTDYIVVGIIQRIVDSEMVLCDFSAKNPNVMYELGIRHAFNKPVILVKDKQTDKVFDIQGLRYTEYDSSLRIDSVQKDIDKISKSITETAASKPDDINSVIQLAGIKAAETPVDRTVSPDTQLLLSAIASIERRLDSPDNRSNGQRFFQIVEDKILFSDNSNASMGDEIYDSNANLIGELIDIHPVDEKIFIQNADGKITPFFAYSIKSKGISSLPF
jgi:hypothetical protein